MRGELERKGGPGPASSPLAATSARRGCPGIGAPGVAPPGEIGGCPARALGGKDSGGKAWGPRAISSRPALSSRRRSSRDVRMPLAPTAPAGKLCPAKSSARLTAPPLVWSAVRPPGPRNAARDCRATPHPASAGPRRQDALRRPLSQPGSVGEPNFALHLHLRLCVGDLAATDPVRQELHQEVRKSRSGWDARSPRASLLVAAAAESLWGQRPWDLRLAPSTPRQAGVLALQGGISAVSGRRAPAHLWLGGPLQICSALHNVDQFAILSSQADKSI